ncbi:BamA/TamA family outer membrane protein [Chitinophagaceae bacterium MMS25-I14]
MIVLRRFFVIVLFLSAAICRGQEPSVNNISAVTDPVPTAKSRHITGRTDELDLIDVCQRLLEMDEKRRVDTSEHVISKLHISGLPAAGYTLQTGFAAIAFANAAFTTYRDIQTNTSTILTSLTYSQYNQVIFPVQSYIWTKDNKYNIVTDWRYVKFPSFTYGLGGNTSLDNGYTIDYSGLRLHQKILRRVMPDLYAGIGYAFDYFWNVRELDPPPGTVTDFQSYGLTSKVKASGGTLNLLYDNRKNPINPEKGVYASAVYRNNLTALGSDANWQSLQLDLRTYVKLSPTSKNVLAFWSYDWFTLGGDPPYLLLPNTGGDPYSNTGRGYIQGRYRGKNMLYAESEYRFGITRDGLLGAVVFANAESVSEQKTNKFETVAPGFGGGLRFKLNKFSRTNVAIDYGVGVGGSKGFFVNLGEVF